MLNWNTEWKQLGVNIFVEEDGAGRVRWTGGTRSPALDYPRFLPEDSVLLHIFRLM